jgi:hypothetical protein
MSVGPFDIGEVIARLRAEVPALRAVEGAAEFAAAVAGTVSPPAAFVLLAQERAEPKTGGSALAIQRIRVTFAVVLAVRNFRRSERGTAQSPDLVSLMRAVRQALMGWRTTSFDPDETQRAATSVDLQSGALVSYDQATVWWQETYSFSYWSRI